MHSLALLPVFYQLVRRAQERLVAVTTNMNLWHCFFVSSRCLPCAVYSTGYKSQRNVEMSNYDRYFGSSVEQRAENMASPSWNIREIMTIRAERGRPFRTLPRRLRVPMEDLPEEESSEEEESSDEEEKESTDEEEEESSEEEDEEEESSDEEEESSDEEEDDYMHFDLGRHRFMEKFDRISQRRFESSVIYCISQHFELDYTTIDSFYRLELNLPLRELREKNDLLVVQNCTCAYFQNGNSPCKHMVLFRILYDAFRGDDSIASRVRRRRRN